jgi:FtsH-binding integral membrane protein
MEHHDNDRKNPQGDKGGFAMMAMMMVCCMSVVLLFLLIPVVGWPIGLTIGAVGFLAMLFVHQRMMGHGGHR